MSSDGAKGAAVRVSIPSSLKKTIENIREFTGHNHSEDEVYAMLKECSMDPNETTQKLLLLDTFHEVKRKRDRKKESQNKEATDSKWKPGTHARASIGNKGNYSSRYSSKDSDIGKHSAPIKEIATGHMSCKNVTKAPHITPQEMKKNETNSIPSPITTVANGPVITSRSLQESHAAAVLDSDKLKRTVNADVSKLDEPVAILSHVDSIIKASSSEIGNGGHYQILDSSHSTMSTLPASANGLLSDPVPIQIIPEAKNLNTPVEASNDNATETNSFSGRILAAKTGNSILQQKIPNELPVVEKNQHLKFLQTVPSVASESSVSMPSSNYSSLSHVIGPQKSSNNGSVKEWKPKSTSSSICQGSLSSVSSEVSSGPVIHPESQAASVASPLEEATVNLQKKSDESHVLDIQHVIIPNHLHVPETEKLWFRFGSFEADFNLDKGHSVRPEIDQSLPVTEPYENIDESVQELTLNNQNEMAAVNDSDANHPDHNLSLPQAPINYSSSVGEVPSSVIPGYIESPKEVTSEIHQHPANHASSNYNFGFMPPVLGSQLLPLERSEAQTRDAPRLPGFVQSMDPTNYYAQFYRSNLDGDGRISPFNPVVAANKLTGNSSLISPQTSQSPQELQGVVPLVLSNSPTPLSTQAGGVMQSSITGNQQPLSVFRQPTGVHLPHYPPNFIPYGPYFSHFYAPPQAILQFLSGGVFPQQPQATSMYPTQQGMAAKYSVPQSKQANNSGSSTQIGVPGNYGPYGISTADYMSGSTTAVSSTANESFSAAQIEENNIYSSGQQSEGSGVWFTTPGPDISALQASPYYNLPQGQLAFAPTQPGHGTFTGIFHPAQAGSAPTVHPLLQQTQAITSPVDMVGPAPHVYQQPQHAQLNWRRIPYSLKKFLIQRRQSKKKT